MTEEKTKIEKKTTPKHIHAYDVAIAVDCSPGTVRIMSESPGSVIARIPTRKYLPQAVPNSILFPP